MEFTYKSGARPLEGYTIKRGLGWGGFGEVYYAHSDAGKEVALKLIQRHLDVELRGVAQCMNLKSPNLVTTFDVRTDEQGQSWIVMEYVAGQSLQARLEALGGPMDAADSLEWLGGIAAAVDFLHQNGIVHRDLKPGNIFREGTVVKVGDYGLSKFIAASRRSGQTQSVGTVHYMAPEISRGNYGRGVDIYSAAIIAFEMLTGDVPFDGETAGEVLMKHLTAEPALDRLAPPFRPVFRHALAKDPAERYGSVVEFVEALVQAHQGNGAPAPTKTPAPALPSPAPMAIPVASPPRRPAGLDASLPPLPGTFKARRRAASELLWVLFLAGLLSGLLPIVVMTGQILFDSGGRTGLGPAAEPEAQAQSLARFVSLAVMSGLASWGLLGLGRLWDSRRLDASGRRMHGFFFGLALGMVWFALDLWLGRRPLPEGITPSELMGLGDPAILALIEPFLVQLSILGLVFTLPDWARCVSKVRWQRFSFWRAVWPASLGIVLASLFGSRVPLDPLWVGSVIGVTAIVVQWVAPHEPKRRHL